MPPCGNQWVLTLVPEEKTVPSFEGELSTNFFEAENGKFIDIVESNDAKVIFLDAVVDASWVPGSSTADCDRGGFGASLAELQIFLPDPAMPEWTCQRFIEFDTLDDLNASSGGPGIVTIRLIGFFKVNNTYVGGRWYFELTEVEVSIEDWEKYGN